MKYCATVFLIAVSITLSGQDLFKLIRNNDYKSVKEYHGAVNLRDSNQATPLMWATYCGEMRMVKLLVNKGADVTLKGWIMLKDSISNFDYIYGSCMAVAAGENKSRLLKYFLHKHHIPADDREINLNGYLENGWTSLHWASVRGNNRPVKVLIRKGADIDAVSEFDQNKTPLLFAIEFSRFGTAEILIRRGADVNKEDTNGLTSLNYALEQKNSDMVKYLVKRGAIPGEQSEKTLNEMLMEQFGVTDISKL
jgi:uncharacterized protein